MCAWRADPVNGRTRLVKDIAREYAASDREITRAFLRVSGGFFPSPLVYKDLDAYVAAWRDAIVKALLEVVVNLVMVVAMVLAMMVAVVVVVMVAVTGVVVVLVLQVVP
jgi:ABC-type uncharacterized transport system fused permease/ATPase subunit